MLPHATEHGRPIKLFDSEHQAFALVFGKAGGKITTSPNRAAIPVGRDDDGAVKRDSSGFRVLSFSFHVLLIVCLLVLGAVLPLAAPPTSTEHNPQADTTPK